MQGKKSFISAKNKPEALTVPIHNISSSQQIMQTISLEKQFNLNCFSKEKIRFQKTHRALILGLYTKIKNQICLHFFSQGILNHFSQTIRQAFSTCI